MNKLFIICGLSFAGKSTLGRAIAETLGYQEVDVDATKVALYSSDVKDDMLTQEEWDHIYEETDRQIIGLLHSGKNVVDASRNFRKAERSRLRALINRLGYETVTIYVTTSEAIVRQRWQENRMQPSRHDLTDENFENIVQAMEPPTADEHPLLFHGDEDMDKWIAKNLHILD